MKILLIMANQHVKAKHFNKYREQNLPLLYEYLRPTNTLLYGKTVSKNR